MYDISMINTTDPDSFQLMLWEWYLVCFALGLILKNRMKQITHLLN